MKKWVLSSLYGVWAVVFILLPVLLIFYYGFTTVDELGRLKLTTQHIVKFFQPIYLGVLWRSVYLAFISTVICLVMGYPMAMILARSTGKHSNFLVLLFVLPMWMNFLMRTYAWLTLLENNGLINSLLALCGFPKMPLLYNEGAVVLGMVYNFLPFMVLPIYTVLDKMNSSLVEAAQDLGASRWNVFSRIILPLSVPGIMSGVAMVFMPAVTTFVISRLLGGSHTSLMGDLIENQFLYANDWNFASAISIIIMVIILATMGVMSRYERENEEGGGLW